MNDLIMLGKVVIKMISFILGFSITLNILFIILTILVVKIVKKKKDVFSFLDCIVDKDSYTDFMK